MNSLNLTSPANRILRFFSVLSLILMMHQTGQAQMKLKDYFITGGSVFVSGLLDGTIESISYHYDNGFKARFPNVNDQFWNPAISWTNKYKNGDCTQGEKFTGSTTVFVFTTDAYHLLRTCKRTLDGVALVYYADKTLFSKQPCPNTIDLNIPPVPKKVANRKKVKRFVGDVLLMTAVRSVGFNLTYAVLFAPQKTHE